MFITTVIMAGIPGITDMAMVFMGLVMDLGI